MSSSSSSWTSWTEWVHAGPWAVRAVFRVLKAVLHWITGTTELQRVCQRTAVPRQRRVQAVEAAIAGSEVVRDVHARLARLTSDTATTTATASNDVLLVAERPNEDARDALQTLVARKRLDRAAPWVRAELEPAVAHIAAYHAWRRSVQRLAETPYASGNAAHEAELVALWSAWRPETPLPARTGAHWTELGFQGADPATDFRGMGILGLRCLAHLARTYPNDATALLLQSQHPVRWFPLAITVIAVANHVRKLLADLWVRHVFYAEPAPLTLDVFLETTSLACIHFGRCWAMATEDITAFPVVFGRHEAAWVHLLKTHNGLPRRADLTG